MNSLGLCVLDLRPIKGAEKTEQVFTCSNWSKAAERPLSQFAHAARTLVCGGPTRPHRPRLGASHSTQPTKQPMPCAALRI